MNAEFYVEILRRHAPDAWYTHLLVSISIRSRYSFDFDKTCVRMSGKLTPFRIFIGQRYDFPIIPFWWGFKA
ncbi:unnamed protein product [Rhizophagus irregularis]|uniref:Uncharacterized protein n=1 Tax=Rhizophagus irregularis TaxID=588596 RepID=A0A915YQA9_9GLOM|nr:unnamed protein product [Rhizophagus irregularis]